MEEYPLICAFSGYPKGEAIEAALRSFSPDVIISDEVGSPGEADAIIDHINSGVSFIASAHGSEISRIMNKPSLESLHKYGAFGLYCGISRDGQDRLRFDIRRRKEATECSDPQE